MNLEINSNFNNHKYNNEFSKELENHLNKPTDSFSIDRFEGDFAVCENLKTNEMVNIKKSLLPENSKEGDIIKFENGKYIKDTNQTEAKQAEIKNLVDNLFKKK